MKDVAGIKFQSYNIVIKDDLMDKEDFLYSVSISCPFVALGRLVVGHHCRRCRRRWFIHRLM